MNSSSPRSSSSVSNMLDVEGSIMLKRIPLGDTVAQALLLEQAIEPSSHCQLSSKHELACRQMPCVISFRSMASSAFAIASDVLSVVVTIAVAAPVRPAEATSSSIVQPESISITTGAMLRLNDSAEA